MNDTICFLFSENDIKTSLSIQAVYWTALKTHRYKNLNKWYQCKQSVSSLIARPRICRKEKNVVLISVFDTSSDERSQHKSYFDDSAFKIMASNNYIKIPEKHKIDVILKKDEEKHLLVDLKYVLEKKALTFFTYFTIGSVFQSGNVYDEQNPRCPLAD